MGIFNLFSKEKNWTLIGTTTVDPQYVGYPLHDKLTPATIEKILFGYTTYIWQDEDGNVRKEEYLGLDETPLRSLIAKVDQDGKSEIRFNDNKYVMFKLQENNPAPVIMELPSQTPTPDISKLPVR